MARLERRRNSLPLRGVIDQVAEGLALAKASQVWRIELYLEHVVDRSNALFHIAATRELHQHPIRLNSVRFYEFDQRRHVYRADFDYLAQDESLFIVGEGGIHGDTLRAKDPQMMGSGGKEFFGSTIAGKSFVILFLR